MTLPPSVGAYHNLTDSNDITSTASHALYVVFSFWSYVLSSHSVITLTILISSAVNTARLLSDIAKCVSLLSLTYCSLTPVTREKHSLLYLALCLSIAYACLSWLRTFFSLLCEPMFIVIRRFEPKNLLRSPVLTRCLLCNCSIWTDFCSRSLWLHGSVSYCY